MSEPEEDAQQVLNEIAKDIESEQNDESAAPSHADVSSSSDEESPVKPCASLQPQDGIGVEAEKKTNPNGA